MEERQQGSRIYQNYRENWKGKKLAVRSLGLYRWLSEEIQDKSVTSSSRKNYATTSTY